MGAAGLQIGGSGSISSLTVGTGSTLAVTAKTTIATAGSLTLAGGTFTTASVDNAGTLNVAQPAVDFGSGLTNTGDLVLVNTTVDGPVDSPLGSAINIIGTVTFNDLIFGAGGIFGSGTAVFGGGFSPGDSPAVVPVENDLVFASTNTLFIELGGTDVVEYDQLDIAGDATLGGTLDVQLIDAGDGPLAPSIGDQFVIATYASRSGTFDDENLPALSQPGANWIVDYGLTALTLRVSGLPGDVDTDGNVDRADAVLLLSSLGIATGSTWLTGDLNFDGATTLKDLAILQANLGRTLPSPASRLKPPA